MDSHINAHSGARLARACGHGRKNEAVLGRLALAVAIWALLALSTGVSALTVNLVDADGNPVNGFRWLLEEDTTYFVQPGVLEPDALAVRFHKSYMPVAANGWTGGSSADLLVHGDPPDPSKRYFVSALPDSGYSNSGASVAAGQTSATITVSSLPLPTAQISVFVFEDNSPVNNSPDLPEEVGLEGFKVVLYEAGGTYGQSGGQMMLDIFGNPLGTVYDANGNMVTMGDSTFTTDANGEVFIKNLGEGKYTLQCVPPDGEGWHQTATIEGTKGIDAWVKPNEPRFFVEFGPPGWHVFIGFIKETNDATVLSGGSTVTGQAVNNHMSRPPEFTFWPGEPVPDAWVGLNDLAVGAGRCIYAAPCDMDGHFAIPNVPPGDYQLAIWDDPLDLVFASKNITVPTGGDLDLGPIPVFNWFARMQFKVFDDLDEDGFPDPGEMGIPNQALNLRFRDGSIYQATVTDAMGEADFHEVFPFFNWLVAEVDYARFKPTGATIVVDKGGPVLPDQGWSYPSWDTLTPQPQFDVDGVTPLINPNTGNNLSRTSTGPAYLLEGFQAFLGQTNVIEWGKSSYDRVDTDNAPTGNFPGPEDVDLNGNGWFDASNGGIAGIVHYATTRAENDPRFCAAENWEPGIPRVQVNLYADYNNDTVIDDLNEDGMVTLADVDNWPFDWRDPVAPLAPQMGPEDIDRNYPGQTPGVFDFGDAMNITTTDSWDDHVPTGAQGEPFVLHGVATDCYDGLRNFNQVRPALFDGGYIFLTPTPDASSGLPEGFYIVEAVTPPGYEVQKEEDKNVDFGDEYVPAQKSGVLDLFPPCVGDLHLVPNELALFPGVPCASAGQMRPLPDRKQVQVSKGQNPPCDFHFFTEVPVAGHIVGIILNDLANEFDPNAPTFGEKYAPPWLPISIRDWTGYEISRVYADEWGAYNALVPSTYTINPPFPSGVSPKMMTVVLNSPGPILDTNMQSPTYGQYITDPFFNRQYSQFSYTFQYDPGKTTYLDTPVLPVGAFTGPGQFPLDCEFPDGTPVLWSVEGGPYVTGPGQELVVASAGQVSVSNPQYDGPGGTQSETIVRDYGFGGTPGTAMIGGVALEGVIWTDGSIRGTVAAGTTTGQLTITRANGKSTVVGITVTVGPFAGAVYNVQPSGAPGATPIQDAIDTAQPGDLILVAPGNYDELVILWKPVQLQGWGAHSVTINAVKVPSEKLQAWRDKVQGLIAQGLIDLLPGQEIGFTGIEPIALTNEEGPGIFVVARNVSPANGGFGPDPNARIDGLTVTGADHGGGILVNGYAHYLEISNNNVVGNQGFFSGGIRVGHPDLTTETALGLGYDHGRNDHIRIHNNHIEGNGGLGGSGGGISLYTGSDNYEVVDNHICGNSTTGNGGGIGHSGLSDGGLIARNTIIFNQSFDQGTNPSGGGIYLGGAAALGGGGLSPGAGSVAIDANLIQGNNAGAGDGGGIALQSVNGQDVGRTPDTPDRWYAIDITNNIIAHNVAGLAGGGIALQDSAVVNIVNNTIVRNDSTATAGTAFAPGSPNQSTAQPAGIVARAHSTALAAAFGTDAQVLPYAQISNPVLVNDIIWQNRSFHFVTSNGATQPFGLVPDPSAPVFWDLGVLGSASPVSLNPMHCDLTSLAGYDASNISSKPLFVSQYYNGNRQSIFIQQEFTTAIDVAAAFDEGGNFIDIRYGPLTLTNPTTGLPFGDYHIKAGSPARDIGVLDVPEFLDRLGKDYDAELRPNGGVDAGADEYYPPGVANGVPFATDDYFNVRTAFLVRFRFLAAPGVLTNDTDPEGQPLTAILVSKPPNGGLTLYPDGSFLYRPVRLFTGTDTFTYKVSDGVNTSNVATVTLSVSAGGNSRPEATPDAYTILQATVLAVRAPGVLANDVNPDGGNLQAIRVFGTNNGTLDLRPNGSFSYTPQPGFTGQDTFRYVAYDGAVSNIVAVTIDVTAPVVPENLPPAPAATAIATTVDTPGITRILPQDPNLLDTFAYAVTEPPVYGTVVLTATGIVNYTPNPGYIGADSVTVSVTDQGGLSATVTIAITVAEAPPMVVSNVKLQCPPDTDGIDTDGDGIVDNDNVCLHLGAGDGFVTMADGKVLYVFGFGDLTNVPAEMSTHAGMLGAECPAPTIAVKEGQNVYLNLTNVGMMMRPDLFDPHTVHFHGFPQAAPVFDGNPEASIAVNMGATFTYFYKLVEPGTFMYHCHVEATEHMQMGMLGNLYVMPKQNGQTFEYPAGSGRTYSKFAYNDGDGSTGYDVEYALQLGGFDPVFHDAELAIQPLPLALMDDKYALINGRGYPDTIVPGALPAPDENGNKPSQKVSSLITAQQGQRILLRLSSLCVTRVFTLASGLPMEIVGNNARMLRKEFTGEHLFYKTNSVTLGGGEAVDAIIDTAGVPAGTYLLYTTNLNYLSNNEEDFGGMMTEIVVSE